jgi:hypothetical protein
MLFILDVMLTGRCRISELNPEYKVGIRERNVVAIIKCYGWISLYIWYIIVTVTIIYSLATSLRKKSPLTVFG